MYKEIILDMLREDYKIGVLNEDTFIELFEFIDSSPDLYSYSYLTEQAQLLQKIGNSSFKGLSKIGKAPGKFAAGLRGSSVPKASPEQIANWKKYGKIASQKKDIASKELASKWKSASTRPGNIKKVFNKAGYEPTAIKNQNPAWRYAGL